MGATVGDSIEIAASPEAVYDMVSDVTRMSEWSPEQSATKWVGGATGPVVGARFRGTNRIGWHRWSTSCTVIDATRGKRFAFHVSDYGFAVSDWIYEFEPTPTGCKVTESTIDRRGFIIRVGGGPVTGVYDRSSHNLEGIRTTLAALKAAAEA
jgi:polyketide cyclase/dehydrase/lipid transport protein